MEPKPVQGADIPIYLGAWGPLGMKRAATIADAWIPGPVADLPKILAAREQYHAALREAGKDPATVPQPLTREVVIAATEAKARELAERHLMVNYRDEYGGGTWSHPLIDSSDKATVTALDAIGKDRFVVGTPDQCIEKIQDVPRRRRRGPLHLPTLLPRHAPRAHHGRAAAAGEGSHPGIQGLRRATMSC